MCVYIIAAVPCKGEKIGAKPQYTISVEIVESVCMECEFMRRVVRNILLLPFTPVLLWGRICIIIFLFCRTCDGICLPFVAVHILLLLCRAYKLIHTYSYRVNGYSYPFYEELWEIFRHFKEVPILLTPFDKWGGGGGFTYVCAYII